LYFCSNRTGRFEVWKMPASGGDPTQVSKDGGFAAVESTDGRILYYSQTRNLGPVLRMPVAGGEPELIIPELRGLFFAVSQRGIYFQTSRDISFWDASSGQIRQVFVPLKSLGIGLAVSPDERSLLFTQVDMDDADLYMIDGLR
jgi:Tol biopolymer transport system component